MVEMISDIKFLVTVNLNVIIANGIDSLKYFSSFYELLFAFRKYGVKNIYEMVDQLLNSGLRLE